VHEDIFAAVFALDEAETLLGIEELDDALAGADDLRGHAATAAATRRAATKATATTAASATAEATAIAAAETATVATAEAAAITAAETAAIAAAAEAAAIITAAAASVETTTATVRIEALFAETVTLVASATTPPSVKTHKNQ